MDLYQENSKKCIFCRKIRVFWCFHFKSANIHRNLNYHLKLFKKLFLRLKTSIWWHRMKEKTFWKKNLGGQILVIFGKNHDFSSKIFLTSPFFWPETDKLPKISGRVSGLPKIFAKKILGVIRQKFRSKFQKVRPSPYRGL